MTNPTIAKPLRNVTIPAAPLVSRRSVRVDAALDLSDPLLVLQDHRDDSNRAT